MGLGVSRGIGGGLWGGGGVGKTYHVIKYCLFIGVMWGGGVRGG